MLICFEHGRDAHVTFMEPLGAKLRQQRRRLSLTLDDLATRTGISKPYLSLIETGRVPNPPSDEKLRALERELGFVTGELVSHAHLQRTPVAVRAMLSELLNGASDPAGDKTLSADQKLSKLILQLAGKSDAVLELPANAIPIINSASDGYPRDFRDSSYPLGAATDFIACPDVKEKGAFAVRVVGDRMKPKFLEGDIVIFSSAVSAKSGDDCFVRFTDGHTVFNRVYIENDETGEPCYRLQPRNHNYRATIVPSDRVAELYRAVYRCHRLDASAD